MFRQPQAILQLADYSAAGFTRTVLFAITGLCSFAVGHAERPLPPQAIADALGATSFFIAPDGDDTNSGLSKDDPKATLEAVFSTLQQRKGYDWFNPYPNNPTRRRGPVHRVTGPESYGVESTGPVIVWVRGGEYRPERTIDLNFADSHPVVIIAYPGEEPVFNGSKVLEGWEESVKDGRRVWRLRLPEVESGDWFFRQLFVNGRRAERPRMPESGYFIVEDSLGGLANRPANQFIAAEGDFREFGDLKDVEISVMHYWQNPRLAVESFDPATRKVTTVNKADYPFLEAHPLHGFGNARYSLENVREALNRPGQWHLSSSTGVLTYLPREGETLANTRIEAPRLVQILRVRGEVNRTRFVQHLRISGLTFKNTAVDFFAHYGTHNNAQNSGPGVISFQGVRYSTIEECRFENIGEYGIELLPGTSAITVIGNRFSEMGCGAVKSHGAWLGLDAPKAQYNWLNIISDNTIIGGGRIYHGSPGIIVNKSGATLVAHNEVADFLYNGIVVGGGPLPQFAAVESRIENNHVYNIGQGELSDMGAIYVHGSASGVVIRGNVAHDVSAKVYGGSVLYLDDSASHITVEDNLFHGGSTYVISMKGREHIIRNNILAFGGNSVIRRSDLEGGRMNTAVVMKNILLTRDGVPVFSSRPETHIVEAPAIISDTNLIWDITGGDLHVSIPRHKRQPDILFPFSDWREGPGNDLRSIIADPRFRDPLNGDFRLPENSPARDVGFRPVDFSNAGPRERGERMAAGGMPAEQRTIHTHVE